jgi:hypothetical protein
MFKSVNVKIVLLSILLLMTVMVFELLLLGLIYLIAGDATDASELYDASEILSDLQLSDIGFVVVALIVT